MALVELDGVTWADDETGGAVLRGARWSLEAGAGVMITLPARGAWPPLADLLTGLRAPEEGAVRWRGRDWRGFPPAEADAARARIGRVFRAAAWLSNLDLDENMLLPTRYHRRRTRTEAAAAALACGREFFGWTELPSARPAWARAELLREAQWVRALLADPELLLIEAPERAEDEIEPAAAERLAERARTNGAAVVRLAAEFPPPAAGWTRWRLRDGALRETT